LYAGGDGLVRALLAGTPFYSLVAIADLATLTIGWTLFTFADYGDQITKQNQTRIYWAAREAGHSKNDILARRDSNPSGTATVAYDDLGWLLYVDYNGTVTGNAWWGHHPFNMTPKQMYDALEGVRNAAQYCSIGFGVDKEAVGGEVRSRFLGSAMISTRPYGAVVPGNITFDAGSSEPPQGKTITGYWWQFWDNTTSSQVSVTKGLFDPTRSYAVSLTVFFSDGSSSTNSLNYWPPGPSFTISPDVQDPRKVTIEASPSDLISSYSWDFGDGFGSGSRKTTHTYVKFGRYTVKLTVRATNGLTLAEIVQEYLTGFSGPTCINSSNITHNSLWHEGGSPYVLVNSLTTINPVSRLPLPLARL